MEDIELKKYLEFIYNNGLDFNNPEIIKKIDQVFTTKSFDNNLPFLESNRFVSYKKPNGMLYFLTEKGNEKLKNLTEDFKVLHEKQNIIDQNTKYSLKINTWYFKTRWLPLAISVITLLFSIVTGIYQVIKNNELEQQIKKVEDLIKLKANDAKSLNCYPTGQAQKRTILKTEKRN